jgi:hypothetical protein
VTIKGQLWYLTQGMGEDVRLSYVNDDGTNHTVLVDNDPSTDLVTSTPQEVALDTAAGLYYILVNSGNLGTSARLLCGKIGSTTAPTVLVTFDANAIVNTLEINPYTNKIYVGVQDGEGDAPSLTGIKQYSYNPSTGSVADQGFVTTVTNAGLAEESGFPILDPLHFDLDAATNTLYYTQNLSGGVLSEGLYRVDLDAPTIVTQMVSQAQFPDSGANGYIIDVAADTTTGKVYFSTESQYPSPDAAYNASQSAIWWVGSSASGATATKLTITGLPNGQHFYPGDITLDLGSRQLYVEVEGEDSTSSDDVIFVFQLNTDGTSASLIRTITPALTTSGANIGGLTFDSLAKLTPVTETTAHAIEQTAYTLLLSDPVITDIDGNHLANATVKLSGSFVGSGDQLSVAGTTTGIVAGTNITVAITTDGSGNQTLTLSGYDTIAHYQQVLGDIRYVANSDDPTNSGANTTRTVTWQVNDGAAGNPSGPNSDVTTFTIDAVNEAPTGSATAVLAHGTEDQGYTVSLANLLAGFTDDEGDPLTISNLSASGGATFVSNGNGTYTVTPAANANGVVSLIYSVTDGNGGSVAATQTVTFDAVNDAPTVAHAIADQTATKDVLFSFIVPDTTFADVDTGDTLIYQATLANGDALPAWLTFDPTTRSFSGTPLAANPDPISVKVTVTDGSAESISDTFLLTTAIGNLAPTDIALSARKIAEDATPGSVVGSLSGVDPDTGDTLTFSLASNPGGTFAIDGNSIVVASGKSLDFETKNSYAVTVRVTDAEGLYYDEAFTIMVTDVIEPIVGSAKNDRLHGTSHADAIRGLGGNDTLDGRAGADKLDGGRGQDTASYASAKAGVVASLAKPATNTHDAHGDQYVSIENLTGSKFLDKLIGNTHANKLDGGAGNDILTGGAGSDIFVFGAKYGKDRITDFAARGSSHDVVDLSHATGINNYADLVNHHLKDIGDDLQILATDGSRLIISDTEIKDLVKADFLF